MTRLKARVEKLEQESGNSERKIYVVDGQIDRSEDDQLRDQGVDPDRLGPNDLVIKLVC
jgi:hypothetical protein